MKERKSNAQMRRRRALLKRIIAISLAASIVLFLAVFFTFVPFRLLLPAYRIEERGEGELRLHFLPVSGGVTVVEFPDGEALVVNAGGGAFAEDNTLCRYLRGLNITSLSVMATSSSTSHVGGMPALFEVFDVQNVYLPAVSADTGAFARFLSAAQKEGCSMQKLVRYDVIANSSGAYAVCLSPYSNEEEGATQEERATMLYLAYAGVKIVLPSDVTQKRENQIVKDYLLLSDIFNSGDYAVELSQIDLLLASSHGADSGSSVNWLNLLRPKATVICCNESERPSQNALSRIATHSESVYRTDELGVITATIKNGGFTIKPHVLG